MMITSIQFPPYSGLRCLMMPYIQGDPQSLPERFHPYADILESVYLQQGDIGYLTIDESFVPKGTAQRTARAVTTRAIHTEAGVKPGERVYIWGGRWGESNCVTLDYDTEILLASNTEDSCAIWDAIHYETSVNGDLGFVSDRYPLEDAIIAKPGEVYKIHILTPHESLPVKQDTYRQFLRILSSGVHGRESYFTQNERMGE